MGMVLACLPLDLFDNCSRQVNGIGLYPSQLASLSHWILIHLHVVSCLHKLFILSSGLCHRMKGTVWFVYKLCPYSCNCSSFIYVIFSLLLANKWVQSVNLIVINCVVCKGFNSFLCYAYVEMVYSWTFICIELFSLFWSGVLYLLKLNCLYCHLSLAVELQSACTTLTIQAFVIKTPSNA